MEKIYSVSEFNQMVKTYIDDIDDFQEIFIEGEISNITYYRSGHLYFSIKDKKAQIKCAAFNYRIKKIPEDLKEGDLIKLFGDVSFYEVKGEFQILVRFIEKRNSLGELFAKLEKIKKKMEDEGYFDGLHKKKLPNFPRNIGVVTALTGAALQDIIKTTRKRFSSINIYVYPAKVQGLGSKEEIVRGIEVLNKVDEIDLIIAGRGGGSVEDLWSFNEEEVAMAFFNSKKPIISAVGHEIDFLLTDLVADARAATPTQAIELSIPDKENLILDLENKEKYIVNILKTRLINMKNNFILRTKNHNLKKFLEIFDRNREKIIEKEERLKKLVQKCMDEKRKSLENKLDKLIVLNPINTLKRGYTVSVVKGKRLSDIEEVKINDEMKTIVKGGKIISVVKEKIYEKINN
ncbi:MAG: exodeoxyribonuclease VII large subunit [Fusobacterium sp.]|uniref:exodeoxyribonuclease VII large subunit n=1 Tax=Fusobacterium sp. TaxID=68766 RepID=UPI0026DC44ED|nr:exodeoxyribonuclease VII large subunit [Fusobacterium sp.]MDO4690201.1 exodeoxyribonuclease VII large subunit [Fusobacterium sp.]